MSQEINLSEDQKDFIKNNYKEVAELSELTRLVFDQDGLDGRSKQGRAVRKFMVDNGLE